MQKKKRINVHRHCLSRTIIITTKRDSSISPFHSVCTSQPFLQKLPMTPYKMTAHPATNTHDKTNKMQISFLSVISFHKNTLKNIATITLHCTKETAIVYDKYKNAQKPQILPILHTIPALTAGTTTSLKCHTSSSNDTNLYIKLYGITTKHCAFCCCCFLSTLLCSLSSRSCSVNTTMMALNGITSKQPIPNDKKKFSPAPVCVSFVYSELVSAIVQYLSVEYITMAEAKQP